MGVAWGKASMSATVGVFLYSAMLLGENRSVHCMEWSAYWRCLLLREYKYMMVMGNSIRASRVVHLICGVCYSNCLLIEVLLYNYYICYSPIHKLTCFTTNNISYVMASQRRSRSIGGGWRAS